LQLQTLPIDVVKLDRAFISGLSSESGRRHAVLAAAAQLVHASGLGLIVEGVETEYEREELLRLDCGFGQGYLFARPVPVGEVLTLEPVPANDAPAATNPASA
ncbi:MAG: EAL domain-containing protein, partial [Actinomycetes bacterium]